MVILLNLLPERVWAVYQILNKENGKSYIGITNSALKHRWEQHTGAANRGESGCPKLYNALRKYGVDGFEFKFLKSFFTKPEAGAYEIALIAELNTVAAGYNTPLGGEGNTLATCKRGHSGAERGTDPDCATCVRDRAREYMRERRKDPEFREYTRLVKQKGREKQVADPVRLAALREYEHNYDNTRRKELLQDPARREARRKSGREWARREAAKKKAAACQK